MKVIYQLQKTTEAVLDLPDRMLMLRAQKGDKQAFASLYKKYLDKLYRYTYFKLDQEQATAEDIVQQTFFKAWEKLHTFKNSKGTVQAWLYRIAHNLIIDHYRENKKTSQQDITEMTITDTNLLPEDLLIKSDELQQLTNHLKKLSVDQQSAIIMYYIEDLSYNQISSILGKKQDAVRALVSRGLKKLKKHINS